MIGRNIPAVVPYERLNRTSLLRFLSRASTILGLILLSTFLALTSPYFLTSSNLFNIGRQTSINAIIAFGMTLVILSGGIDLSVGAVLAFSSCVMAGLIVHGFSISLCISAALVIGGGLGFVNGTLITKARIPPFIATLGMMNIARGAALTYTHGYPISGLGPGLAAIGRGYVGPIPMPVLICVFIFLICWFLLRYTVLGRSAYAIGGNEEGARLSGIDVDLYKISFYVICGLLAAIAGVVQSARLNSSQPIAGIGYELDAIAAVVIGGTSLFGGEGSIGGTFIGALVMGVLRNGLNLLNVSPFTQDMVIGGVIIGAVFIDVLRKRRSK